MSIETEIDIEKMETETVDKTKIQLELGDILLIHAPSNTEINDSIFIIIYLSNEKIEMINTNTLEKIQLKLDENGLITDESIQSIDLLSRSDEKGYARQNKLYPKTWIDIHFGGEVPTILTGEITDLVEDQIEITVYPEMEVIYIDFAYQGIPDYMPIENIVIRPKPASLEKVESLIQIREQLEKGEAVEIEPNDEASIEYLPSGEAIVSLPENVKPDEPFQETLHKIYLSADQVIYGQEVEGLVQKVEIAEHKKRYAIEVQVNDMLDEMLSTIPTNKRTETVLNQIHLLILRFRELRQTYSKFDGNGNVFDINNHGDYKPLVKKWMNLNHRLRWILPVVALRRKIYTTLDPEGIDDISKLDDLEVLGKEVEYAMEYKESALKGGNVSLYTSFYQKLYPNFQPVESPDYPEKYLAPNQAIQTELECIVKNLEEFYSTVHSKSYRRQRFVIDRYNLGQSMLKPSMNTFGKTVYLREPIHPNDNITIKSLVVLPEPALEYSKIDLPNSSILLKSDYSQKYLYLFRLLHRSAQVFQKKIENFSEDLDKENWESEDAQYRLSQIVQEFILDESLEEKNNKYQNYLKSMIPSISTTIDLLIKKYPNKLSLKRIVEILEPFGIEQEDLVYTHYNKIRYYIKTHRSELLKQLEEKKKQISYARNIDYHTSPSENVITEIFQENTELRNLFMNYYHDTKRETKSQEKDYIDPTESLLQILEMDNGMFYSTLIQDLMASLITPEDLLNALENEKETEEDLNKYEKIKAKDCLRRVLTKKYTSLKDLQKDNGTEDVFYDKEYDSTPYEWMKRYEDARKKYSGNELVDYIAENLIQKHDCPNALSKEMAESLILGKKLVQEGEYAILEIRPQLPKEQEDMSKIIKQQIERESEIRKLTTYYRRKGKEWVRDETIDETAFIDTNTLFCNMDKMCFSNRKNNVCESMESTEKRMNDVTKKQLMNEFGERFAISMEKHKEEIAENIRKNARVLRSSKRLNEIIRRKYDYYAYELGKLAQDVEIKQSPFMNLRDKILGQDDFVKKQSDIIQFVTLFCRDPVEDWRENMFWYYCIDTNIPLLPSFLYQLAQAYVTNKYDSATNTYTNNYGARLSEICRVQGRIEDNRIVDKHSGFTIRYIDFVEEQGYDEAGFKIITGDVMEKDEGEIFLDVVANVKKQNRIFESKTSEMIFAIYKSISGALGLPIDSIEEFILQSANELIRVDIKSETVYQKEVELAEKQNKKRPPPYEFYYNKSIILIVASLVLVGIQTAIPSFKIHKTNPGCAKSFRGFPENGGSAEDMSGLNYLACVLNKLKTSFVPWNSIKPIPLPVLTEQLRKTIEIVILKRSVFQDMYAKKREYNVLHPEIEIPKNVALQKWIHFMPPLVKIEVSKNLTGLSAQFKEELDNSQRTNNTKQREIISVYKSKTALFGLNIIQLINDIVSNKDIVLRTASNLGFLENACCNDRNSLRALDYFVEEDKTIAVYAKMIEGWEKVLNEVQDRSRARFLVHSPNTRVKYPLIHREYTDMNIYSAFIYYLNLDKEFPIPEPLRVFMTEKPHGYQSSWNLLEKIEFLKSQGKRFTLGQLNQLMNIIHQQNHIIIPSSLDFTIVHGLQDLLQYFDDHYGNNDSGLDYEFRSRLKAVLEKYDENKMVSTINDETVKLNKWLINSNEEYLDRIGEFFETHGNLSTNEFNKLQRILSEIHMWNLDPTRNEYEIPKAGTDETSMYTVIQFMKNSIYYMTRVYPEIICNNHTNSDIVHKHWEFSGNHNKDIQQFLKNYYKPLDKFKHNKVLQNLLRDLQRNLTDLYLFLQYLPVGTPIHKESENKTITFYSLFDKRTLYLIYTNLWYSILYKYMEASENSDYLEMNIQEQRKENRESIQNENDPFAINPSVPRFKNNEEAEYNDIVEMQIEIGNQKEFQRQVAEMLLAFLDMDEQNKKILDVSYEQLEKRITRSKMNEKKIITDSFRDMESDQRKAEVIMKDLKLGRWNIGLQSGLFKYDKNRYDEERSELYDKLTNKYDMDDEYMPIHQDIDQLEKEEQDKMNQDSNDEAMDIQGLGEDYRDGYDGFYFNEDEE